MKYPKVIFYRLDKYSNIDTLFKDNYEKLECDVEIISNNLDIKKLFDVNYHVLVTYGNEGEYISLVNDIIVPKMRKRWIHLTELYDLDYFSKIVTYCYIECVINDRNNIRPIFSLFTTCYESFDKIIRAYKSIKCQTFKDWEWVIVDDSKTREHFDFLIDLFKDDPKVRLYKRSCNSGSIGNVKNEAISLCRGQYLLEMDHDDEITETLLEQSVIVFENHPDVGFIYSNCTNIDEDGVSLKYDDFYGKGYCSYYCEKYKNKWVYVCSCANINNITGTHLVSMPNHPRIWRSEVLRKIGSYCELLPICDDQEIIMRTMLETKIAKIHMNGYIQYINRGQSNFSLIRNYEINKIGPNFLYPQFYSLSKFHEKMKEKDAYENESYIYNCSQIWKRQNYEHKYCNLLINNEYEKQCCIIGIDALIENIEYIKQLYNSNKCDIILLENTNSPIFWCKYLDYYGFTKMKCYSLNDCSYEELEKYFLLTYKSCINSEIIYPKIKKIPYNTNLNSRIKIIESLTNKDMKYLEIGVEYGNTFKDIHFNDKIGVDPDPKFEDNNLVKLTSDNFFAINKNMFDVIFIDGMHQIEYLINDFNNSVNTLNENGIIFIDDILPLNYNEQLKIPNHHYYENNILKYGEPWTGDIWKLLYWILLNFANNIKIKYYTNINYRGVACIHFIQKFNIDINDIEEINKFCYFYDFNDYTKLLNSLN